MNAKGLGDALQPLSRHAWDDSASEALARLDALHQYARLSGDTAEVHRIGNEMSRLIDHCK